MLLTLVASLVCMVAGSAVAQSPSSSAEVASGSFAMVRPAAVAPVPSTTPPVAIDAPTPHFDAVVADIPVGPAAVPVDQPGGYEIAPIHTKYILPEWRAQPLHAGNKVIIGLESTYSLFNFAGIIAAAGWEQLTNGQPNYGTDRGAFGERLGAAGIRNSAQAVFSESVFASLLHEDPRYYVEGSQYSIGHRALYALTRPLITRTDSGRRSINGALLLGYASAAALNNAYYPPINRNFADSAKGYAGSVGGAALGCLVAEFSASLWNKLHLGYRR